MDATEDVKVEEGVVAAEVVATEEVAVTEAAPEEEVAAPVAEEAAA
jgi:hypothetical protein